MSEGKKSPPISFFNSRLISIISISLVLFLMGLFCIIGWLSHEMAVYVKENISFTIVLKDGVQVAEIQRMKDNLNQLPFIKSIEYISKEEAAKTMEIELGEDPQVFLGFNPFQASIEARLNSEYSNPDSLQMIENKISKISGVSELIFQKEMIQEINRDTKRLELILIILIAILMLILFGLITNTVRLLIYSKRFLIYTMRLVGATPGFIRRPFIRYTAFNGFLAGLVAIIMLTFTIGGIYYMIYDLKGLEEIVHWEGLLIIYGMLLFLGMFTAALAAHFAVTRYLNMKQGKMYYI